MANIENRKARHEYFIESSFTSGMVLRGTEIKSIRAGQVNMGDAYCVFSNGQIIVKNLHISEFKQGSHFNHIPIRDRVLLFTKSEKKKLFQRTREKGYSMVPLRIFISETGYAKMEVGLAKGKKAFDKRESIKEREQERDLRRGDN